MISKDSFLKGCLKRASQINIIQGYFFLAVTIALSERSMLVAGPKLFKIEVNQPVPQPKSSILRGYLKPKFSKALRIAFSRCNCNLFK